MFRFKQPEEEGKVEENVQKASDVIMKEVPEIPSVEQIPDSQNSQNEHEISQTYEGAPAVVSSDTHSDTSTMIQLNLRFVVVVVVIFSRFKRLKFNLHDGQKLSI